MGRSDHIHDIKAQDIRLVYGYLQKDRHCRSSLGIRNRLSKFKLKKIIAEMLKVSVRTVSRIIDTENEYGCKFKYSFAVMQHGHPRDCL